MKNGKSWHGSRAFYTFRGRRLWRIFLDMHWCHSCSIKIMKSGLQPSIGARKSRVRGADVSFKVRGAWGSPQSTRKREHREKAPRSASEIWRSEIWMKFVRIRDSATPKVFFWFVVLRSEDSNRTPNWDSQSQKSEVFSFWYTPNFSSLAFMTHRSDSVGRRTSSWLDDGGRDQRLFSWNEFNPKRPTTCIEVGIVEILFFERFQPKLALHFNVSFANWDALVNQAQVGNLYLWLQQRPRDRIAATDGGRRRRKKTTTCRTRQSSIHWARSEPWRFQVQT